MCGVKVRRVDGTSSCVEQRYILGIRNVGFAGLNLRVSRALIAERRGASGGAVVVGGAYILDRP